jgi:hypothetical protein
VQKRRKEKYDSVRRSNFYKILIPPGVLFSQLKKSKVSGATFLQLSLDLFCPNFFSLQIMVNATHAPRVRRNVPGLWPAPHSSKAPRIFSVRGGRYPVALRRLLQASIPCSCSVACIGFVGYLYPEPAGLPQRSRSAAVVSRCAIPSHTAASNDTTRIIQIYSHLNISIARARR